MPRRPYAEAARWLRGRRSKGDTGTRTFLGVSVRRNGGGQGQQA